MLLITYNNKKVEIPFTCICDGITELIKAVLSLTGDPKKFYEIQFDYEPGTVKMFILKKSRFNLMLSVYQHQESNMGCTLEKDDEEPSGTRVITTPLDEYEHLLHFECTVPQLAQALYVAIKNFQQTQTKDEWPGLWGRSFSYKELKALKAIGDIHVADTK